MRSRSTNSQVSETVRVTINDSGTSIVIHSGSLEIVLEAEFAVTVDDSERLLNVVEFIRVVRAEEYVISFDFASEKVPARGIQDLRRLDICVVGVTVSLQDGGYIIEGELLTWVAYTNAYEEAR